MARTLLECGQNVVLVTDRRDHDDASVRMLLDDALDSLDAFHLRHGDVHEDDVGIGAGVFGDGSAAVPGFADDLAAERFDHLRETLTCKDRVVNDQVASRLVVFLPRKCFKLFHNYLLREISRSAATGAAAECSGKHFDWITPAKFESETTRSAKPRSMAARGMLSTTHVSGL